MRRSILLQSLAALAMFAPVSAFAQRIHGIVTDSASGSPVPAAAVLVLDSARQTIGRGITSRSGAFSISYAGHATLLRVQHVGHLPHESGVTPAVASGDVEMRVMLGVLPMSLHAVVSAADGCRGLPHAEEATGIWERVRDAFLAAVIARDDGKGTMRIISYERTFDPGTGVVSHERITDTTLLTARPTAARSADDLADHGYVDADSIKSTFYGPDVDALLDQRFASSHCFYLRDKDNAHPGATAIGFMPVVDRAGFSDINGVLWIDEKSLTPLSLDYTYTQIFSRLVKGAMGGSLTFRAMPNGVPVINRWSIRTSPAAVRAAAPRRLNSVQTIPRSIAVAADLVASTESGAEVIDATWPDSTHWSAVLSTISGTTIDSTTGHGTPDVRVVLLGTPYETTSDAAGHYMLRDVVPGAYIVEAGDAAFKGYHIVQIAGITTELTRERTTQLDLLLHPIVSIATTWCNKVPAPDSVSNMLVRVLSPDRGDVLSLRTSVEWQHLPLAIPVRQVADSGTFVACDVPWNLPVGFVATGKRGLVDSTLHLVARPPGTVAPSMQVVDTLTVTLAPTPPIRGLVLHGSRPPQ